MRRRKSPKQEELKPENVDSVIAKNTSAAAMKERQDIEDPFREYPPPPEEHDHELEMEKRLKRLIEERERET